MTSADFHPVAEIFPLMTGASFDELVHDIQINGLREPIWLHEGKIIDGRNRFNACLKGGVSPKYRDWDGTGTLVGFVVSLNLHRRHLSESQRAMVAAKISNRPEGRPPKETVGITTVSTGEAAEMLNVHRGTVAAAKRVQRDGVPEVIAAVESGELSIHAAGQIVAEPHDQQAKVLEERRKPRTSRVSAPSTNGKSKTLTKTYPGRKAPEAIRNAIGTLVGIATGLNSFAVKDAAPDTEESKQWERDLGTVVTSVNRFRRELKEYANVQAQ